MSILGLGLEFWNFIPVNIAGISFRQTIPISIFVATWDADYCDWLTWAEFSVQLDTQRFISQTSTVLCAYVIDEFRIVFIIPAEKISIVVISLMNYYYETVALYCFRRILIQWPNCHVSWSYRSALAVILGTFLQCNYFICHHVQFLYHPVSRCAAPCSCTVDFTRQCNCFQKKSFFTNIFAVYITTSHILVPNPEINPGIPGLT